MPAALFLFYFMYSDSVGERDSKKAGKASEREWKRERNEGKLICAHAFAARRWFFYYLLKKSKLNLRQKLCGFSLFFCQPLYNWSGHSECVRVFVRVCVVGMWGWVHNSSIFIPFKLIFFFECSTFIFILVARSGLWQQNILCLQLTRVCRKTRNRLTCLSTVGLIKERLPSQCRIFYSPWLWSYPLVSLLDIQNCNTFSTS